RAIVAAADESDGPFDLYEIPFDTVDNQPPPLRRLTSLTGGATWPDISSDGRTLVFVGYTIEGFDLFEMPYPLTSADLSLASMRVHASEPPNRDVSGSSAIEGEPSSARRYSPLPTLAPRSWRPILEGSRDELRLGAETDGTDVLGYHGYALSA